jgi:hypothetical protein
VGEQSIKGDKMPDYLVTLIVLYYLVGVIILFILIAGMDKYSNLANKYGVYRGYTLEAVVIILIAAFWLPYALFFLIRGLIRGD